jgi:hypothetical protein
MGSVSANTWTSAPSCSSNDTSIVLTARRAARASSLQNWRQRFSFISPWIRRGDHDISIVRFILRQIAPVLHGSSSAAAWPAASAKHHGEVGAYVVLLAAGDESIRDCL